MYHSLWYLPYALSKFRTYAGFPILSCFGDGTSDVAALCVPMRFA